MAKQVDLLKQAEDVLRRNDNGQYTLPNGDVYPHQWLWDSCFISIGLRHMDLERAKSEIRSLIRGQWHNGMMPNMIFSGEDRYQFERNVWRSWISPQAPEDVATSGITQPPMLAEAVVQIGKKMTLPERRLWYKEMITPLVRYHEWLYNERDPHEEGLVVQIHPWETGLDNTPPWMDELHDHLTPLWIRAVGRLKIDSLINRLRADVKHIPADERVTVSEGLTMFSAQRRLRRKAYDIEKILDHSLFLIEDLNFNSILIRANGLLIDIAKTINYALPGQLKASMARTTKELEELWEPYSNQYYSRDFIEHRLLKTPSIATLLPLYGGSISAERAASLVKLLENEHQFGTAFPVPSVPVSSFWFSRKRYWQGPSWINTNWLIIEGLKSYGYNDHAEALTESTLEMVAKSGFYEYFDPVSGEGHGAKDFSWTAALVVDLINS